MSTRSLKNTDQGFGLVEVVVAMFLLVVLAVAILPALIRATGLSVDNKSRVAATNLATQRLAGVTSLFPTSSTSTTCTALQGSKNLTATLDAASGLYWTTDVGACPTTNYPASVAVTVTVYTSAAKTTPLVTLPTKVLVAAP